MKCFNYIILSIFILNIACTECKDSDTKLTNETKEWFKYFQNNDYSVFKYLNVTDTLTIKNRFDDPSIQIPEDNCSFNGDCYCEIKEYDFKSNLISFSIKASNQQKIFFQLYNVDNFSIGPSYFVNDNNFNSDGYFNPSLEEYSYKGNSYNAIVIECIKCNEVPIKKLVISKELGVFEYIDKEDNVWVKQ